MSLRFDPSDPFPLIKPGKVDSQSQKKHAAQADLFLGYRVHKIEANLLKTYSDP